MLFSFIWICKSRAYVNQFFSIFPNCDVCPLRPKAKPCFKKKSTAVAVLFFLEASPRFELGNKSFADFCLTTWLWRLIKLCCLIQLVYYTICFTICQDEILWILCVLNFAEFKGIWNLNIVWIWFTNSCNFHIYMV